MKDDQKTKRKLIEELNELRQCVAELKGFEEEIKQTRVNHEKFTKAFLQNSIPVAITTLKEGRFVDVSDAFLSLMGRKRDEVVGHTSTEIGFITEEQRVSFFNELSKGGRIENLEMKVRTKGGALRDGLFNAVMMSINNDKHLLTVMTDITERKQAEEALRRTEENFRRSVEDFPLGVRIVTTEGETIYANRAILDIHGYETVEDLISTPVKKRYTPESYAEFKIRREKRKRGDYGPSEYEVSIVRKNGEVRYLQVFRKRVLWGGERQFQVIYQDITERKQAEKTLQLITDNMSDMIRVTDLEGVNLYTSPSLFNVLGYKPEERVGKSAFDIVHPDDLEYVINVFSEGLVNKKPAKREYRIKHAEGHYIWLETVGDFIRDDHGEVTAVIQSSRDITDRKRAEEALQESEEKYRVIFNNEIYAICIFDLETLTLLDVNDTYSRIYGYSREELITGMTIHDITAEHQVSDTATKQAIREGTIFIPLRYHQKKDGTVFPVEIVGGPYSWKGCKVMFALAHDITERERTEQELQRSNERSQAVQRIGRVGYLDWDLLTNDLVLSKEALEIYHLDRTPTLDQIMDLIHPDDKERLEKSLSAAVSGTARHDLEHRMICPDGTEIYLQATAELFRSDDGTPARLLGTIQDITDRKRAEEALKEVTDRLLLATKAGGVGIWDLDVVNNNLTWDDQMFHLYGIKPENFGGAYETWKAGVHPEDVMRSDAEVQMALRGEKEFDTEFRVVWPDGTIHHIAARAQVHRNAVGQPTELFGTNYDITERKRAEEALRESEVKYRTLVENASDMVYRTDGNGYFTFVNPAVIRITGYEAEDIIGKHYKMILRPEVFKTAITFFTNQLIKKIPNTYYEYPIITKDGQELWIGQNMQLIMEGDRVIGFQSVARDITDRKQAEAKLRESEEKYRNILESIEDGYYEVDLVGNFTFFNPSMCTILGYDREDMPGMNNRVFMDRENAKKVFQAFSEVYASGIPKKGFEWEIIQKSGSRRHLEVSVSPITNPGVKPTGFRGIARDITGKRRVEETLRANEEKYRNILENMNDSYYETDLRGNMTFCNPMVPKSLGYSPEEMMGMNHRMYMDAENTESVERNFRDVYGGHIPSKVISYEVIRKDKTKAHVEASISLIKNKDGHSIGYRGIGRDITSRKQVEAEKAILETQNRQLQKAESLGRMAEAIAHHFNNQLGVVVGNLEMAIDVLPQGAEPINSLTTAMQAAWKAADMSGLMLTYIGQSFDKREPLDLSDACRRSLPLLKAVIPGNVIMETDLPSTGPIIMANAPQMQQVLSNLITNAWEAIGDGRGTIRLKIKTVSPIEIAAAYRNPIDWQSLESAYACMEVNDTGYGIEDMDVEKLFDPFFTTKFTGRGMGLAAVLGIVKAHGGAVTVESQPSCGTTFRVFIPVSREEVLRQPDKEGDTDDLLISAVSPIEMERGGTVLLVEDEEMVRNMAAAMLKRLGFSVLEAKDGVEAVEVFRKHQDEILCVLSDLTMPRMNGWETLTALRKIKPDLPVILASGYDEAHVMAGDHPELPQVFLGKPYKLKGLSDAISQALVSRK